MMNYVGPNPELKKQACDVWNSFISNGIQLYETHGQEGMYQIARKADELMHEEEFEKALDMIDSNL